jgi:hypothetical protein
MKYYDEILVENHRIIHKIGNECVCVLLWMSMDVHLYRKKGCTDLRQSWHAYSVIQGRVFERSEFRKSILSSKVAEVARVAKVARWHRSPEVAQISKFALVVQSAVVWVT